MITLVRELFESDEANMLLQKHYSTAVRTMMDHMLADYRIAPEALSSTDNSFNNFIEEHTGFTSKRSAYLFKELYSSVISEYPEELSFGQNSLLNSIINYYIDYKESLGEAPVYILPDEEFFRQQFKETCRQLLINCYLDSKNTLVINENLMDSQTDQFIEELEDLNNLSGFICQHLTLCR